MDATAPAGAAAPAAAGMALNCRLDAGSLSPINCPGMHAPLVVLLALLGCAAAAEPRARLLVETVGEQGQVSVAWNLSNNQSESPDLPLDKPPLVRCFLCARAVQGALPCLPPLHIEFVRSLQGSAAAVPSPVCKGHRRRRRRILAPYGSSTIQCACSNPPKTCVLPGPHRDRLPARGHPPHPVDRRPDAGVLADRR